MHDIIAFFLGSALGLLTIFMVSASTAILRSAYRSR